MKIYMSRDARKVFSFLSDRGIDLPIGHIFRLEVLCSIFHANHITQVIGQVLSGKNRMEKLMRAQEQGIGYFWKPVLDMLSTRKPAIRKAEHFDPDTISPWAEKVFSVVATQLMATDVGRDEMDILLFDIPLLVQEQLDLVVGIRVCIDQSKRSIFYLRGVLQREQAQRKAKTEEVLRSRSPSEPWQPPEGYQKMDEESVADFEKEWGLTEDAIMEERWFEDQNT